MLPAFQKSFLYPSNLPPNLMWNVILAAHYKTVNIHPWHKMFWLSSLCMFIFLQIKILTKLKIWAGDLWLSWQWMTQLELMNAYNIMHVCVSYLQLFYTFIYSDIYPTKIQHLQVDRDHECEDEGDNKCSHFTFKNKYCINLILFFTQIACSHNIQHLHIIWRKATSLWLSVENCWLCCMWGAKWVFHSHNENKPLISMWV